MIKVIVLLFCSKILLSQGNEEFLFKELKLWRDDTTECKTFRSSLLYKLELTPEKSMLDGLKRKELLRVLGRPDKKTLLYFDYILNDSPTCPTNDYTKISIFVINRVKSVSISIGD